MKDAITTECNFQVDMAPYMYGEMSLSEQAAFESHLIDCPECTDEFAAISNARYEVYDWKKLEFDPLETPRFEIPFEESVAAVSWVDKIRVAFGNGWAVPGFAFAGLAIVAILAAVYVGSGDIAPDVTSNISKASPEVTEQTAPKTEAPVAESKTSVDSQADSTVVQTDAEAPSRRSTPTRTVRREKPAAQTFVEPRGTSAGRVQPKVPVLNEPVEEEDTSLRLAELFDDVETSE